MKKLLSLILAAALALSLVACGGGSGAGDTNTPNTGNGDTTSTDTPSGGEDSTSNGPDISEEIPELSIGETITVGEIDFTLNWVEIGKQLDAAVSSDNFLKTPDEAVSNKVTSSKDDAKVLAAFSISAKNLGKETCTFNLENCFAIDYNGGYKFSCDNTYTFHDPAGSSLRPPKILHKSFMDFWSGPW